MNVHSFKLIDSRPQQFGAGFDMDRGLQQTPSLPSFPSVQKEFTMHPQFSKADALSREAIGAAIEVHRILGPGLLESIYEKCLLRELEIREIAAITQDQVEIEYKGITFTEKLKFDLLVDGCLLIEVKAVQTVHPVHKAQLLSYMKLLDVPLGLLLNFHEMKLIDGLSRMILPGANK